MHRPRQRPLSLALSFPSCPFPPLRPLVLPLPLPCVCQQRDAPRHHVTMPSCRHFGWTTQQLAQELDTQPHRVAWAVVHFRLRGADPLMYLDDDDDNMARLWQWNALPRSAAVLSEEERRGRERGGGG